MRRNVCHAIDDSTRREIYLVACCEMNFALTGHFQLRRPTNSKHKNLTDWASIT